jgi:hypothetical protein
VPCQGFVVPSHKVCWDLLAIQAFQFGLESRIIHVFAASLWIKAISKIVPSPNRVTALQPLKLSSSLYVIDHQPISPHREVVWVILADFDR